MILVLLGTQNNSFHRLLDEIERNIQKGNIEEEVVVQAGFTKYKSDNMKIFDMTSQEILKDMINDASLVITHSGVGSIEMSLEEGKKVIAVPRKKIYGEHVNDHQSEITKKFLDEGYLIGLGDVAELEDALNKVKSFIPKKYINSNSLKLINTIKGFIN